MKLLGFLFLPLLRAGSSFDVYMGDTYPYRTAAMVTDAAGNTYLTGGRVLGSLLDVFITKLDPSGNVIFTVTTGGKGSDAAGSIAVDGNGDIWIAGGTTSPDFPLLHPIQSVPSKAGTTGFIVEASSGGSIIFSSYFGGTLGASGVSGIAVDSSGNAYVTGGTLSSDFPTTAGMPSGRTSNGGVFAISGAFIAKISEGGSKIVYSGLLVGGASYCVAGSPCFLSNKDTGGAAIAVDNKGQAYFTGNTDTTNLPVTPGALNSSGLGPFVGAVKADGSGLAYLTYLTKAPQFPVLMASAVDGESYATAIAVDSSGAAYVTGYTGDPNFPATPGAYQTTYTGPIPSNPYTQGPSDVFVAKLTADGTALEWATYLGGSANDDATSIALDSSDTVWLSGTTGSPDFPNASGWSQGGDFIVGMNSSGSALTYSARYPNSTVSIAVAVDPAGLVHAAGVDGMASAFLPASQPAAQIQGIANAAAGYVTGRIVPGEVISIYGVGIGPATPVSATPSKGAMPTTLGGVQVTIGGYAAPLLYVSPWQINAVVPFELTGSTNAVEISFGNTTIPTFTAITSPGEPGIFTTSNGVGVFDSSSTFAPGSIASMWVTGINLSNFGVTDGQIATTAQQAAPTIEVLIGGNGSTLAGTLVPAAIVYEGLAPGLVDGVMQINFQVPLTGFDSVTVVAAGHDSPVAN